MASVRRMLLRGCRLCVQCLQAIGTQAVLHAAVRIQQQFAAGPERQRHAPARFGASAIDHAADKFSTAL
jgi:hypothetical protein